VQRTLKPSKRMNNDYQSGWEDIVHRKWPNNGQVHFDNGRTMAKTVHGDKLDQAGIAYLVFYAEEGKIKDDLISSKLAKIDESLAVLEPTADRSRNSGGKGGSKKFF